MYIFIKSILIILSICDTAQALQTVPPFLLGKYSRLAEQLAKMQELNPVIEAQLKDLIPRLQRAGATHEADMLIKLTEEKRKPLAPVSPVPAVQPAITIPLQMSFYYRIQFLHFCKLFSKPTIF